MFGKHIITATAMTAIIFAAGSTALRAQESSSIESMKPMHGISFDIGTSRAVSYFLSDNGQCKLVLTIAEELDWDHLSDLKVKRFEAAVPSGKATRYNATQGTALEFECLAEAQAMTVRHLGRYAAEAKR